MTWYAWAMIGAIVASTALVILNIGKPRQPIDPATALCAVVINGLLVWGVIALAGSA